MGRVIIGIAIGFVLGYAVMYIRFVKGVGQAIQDGRMKVNE